MEVSLGLSYEGGERFGKTEGTQEKAAGGNGKDPNVSMHKTLVRKSACLGIRVYIWE